MTTLPLQLPTIQNWSCHNCGGCCRQHAIEITQEEYERIQGQGWTGQPGYGTEQPLFEWHAGPPWKKRYRLAHRSDGACVFLNEQGLCRIHAKFGEPAKPLACRVYPYAFHPAGKEITISLRFSCPSVVANRGKSLSANKQEIKTLERLVVPPGAEKTPPPAIRPGQKVDWRDFLRFVEHLDETLAEPNMPILQKLLRALAWMKLVGQARFEKIRGERLDDFLQIVRDAAREEVGASPGTVAEPTSLARTQFRLLVAQYARKDTSVEVRSGWTGRIRLLQAALRFARGTGDVPPLQDQFRPVPFAALEQPFGALPDGAEEIFTRYFRVKLQGLHFCGPAYYGVPLVEGFQSLALIFPAILWIARWLAVGEGRSSLGLDDITRAVAIADHHHGYSPAFGQPTFRRRVRTLAQMDQIQKLCGWYCR